MFCSFDQFSEVFATCQRSKVGKLLPDALYVHVWALQALDPLLQDYESEARQIAPDVEGATLVKFNIGKPKISEVNWKHKRSVTEKLWFQSQLCHYNHKLSKVATIS
jgi:hypothetical protein